jgi:hypothetical protein
LRIREIEDIQFTEETMRIATENLEENMENLDTHHSAKLGKLPYMILSLDGCPDIVCPEFDTLDGCPDFVLWKNPDFLFNYARFSAGQGSQSV